MKTRIKIPYLNQFAIIAKWPIILFLNAYIWKERKKKQEGLKPTGLNSLRSKPQSCVKEEDPTQTERHETDSVMEIYDPFLSDGFVSLNSDYVQSTPILEVLNLLL